ncbi:MAG: methionine synthase [bacterium]
MEKSFLDVLKEKIMVFDGATGTHLQSQGLTADDFGGEEYNGCNEYLVIAKPSAVENVHADYLDAGCDVIETDTFGGASIVLAEYNLQDRAYELNYKAAQIARRVAADFSQSGHQRFVAGSLGPTTKLPTLGHIAFPDMLNSYYVQAKGLLEGGVDLLSVETCQDILQAKAALCGITDCFRDLKKKVPVSVSVTIESTGTMLLGTEIIAALTSLEPFDIDLFGMNCATGPKEMSEHIHALASSSPMPLFVMPNAGLPENVGGQAHYHLSPEEFVEYLSHFVKDLGVQAVGGCCGTTKSHLKKLVDAVGNLAPRPRSIEFVPAASSLYQAVPYRTKPAPTLVGERTNANGSKLFRDLLAREDWESMVAMGREQAKEQAHMVDLCVAYVGRNEAADVRELVPRFNTQVSIPLVIDSTEVNVLEEALQRVSGKAIVNSINLEDGEARLERIVHLCKRYGAAVIALVIDEQGMAKTIEKKLEVARRIYDLAVRRFGMRPHDLIFDMLTFTLGSGDEEFRHAGADTIEAIRRVKQEFPEVQTLLGVSNISFGLAPRARHAVNSVFLHYAVEAGLDMAIVHASKILPLFKLDEQLRSICSDLIYDKRRYEGEQENRTLVYDPLTELITYGAVQKQEVEYQEASAVAPLEERLTNRIIDGNKAGIQRDLDEALKTYTPLEIINTILLGGMKRVGELFGSGQMQLPFVLQAAEAMKTAVAHLETFMEKTEGSGKGVLVLATVKGDVHDIGKNLVDIILTNNGYTVINLGIKCTVETMLHAAQERRADAIGMSGLLVKSTLIMKENLEVMNERGLTIPVILGGAALTRRYVESDLRPLYKGRVYYANDAFDGLRLLEQIKSGQGDAAALQESVDEETLTGSEAKIAMSLQQEPEISLTYQSHTITIRHDHQIPQPPFWGSKVVTNLDLQELYPFINEVALIRGQWRVVRGTMSAEAYQQLLKKQVYPDFEFLKAQAQQQYLLEPRVVYGYFPCQSSGDDLIVYQPLPGFDPSIPDKNLSAPIRFAFPRQSSGKRLCIADFFASTDSGRYDVLACHVVTVGRKASEHSAHLYAQNNYKDYLYFHGLSVETTEALAEYWHKRIRVELGVADRDAKEIKKLFSQGYQGSRYSFGYPACPKLEDQVKLFQLLTPERIEVSLTEGYQMEPEQSTSAIIVHHPEARYFTV